MHSEVSCLFRGKVLEQFPSLLPEACTFLDSKRKVKRPKPDHTAGPPYWHYLSPEYSQLEPPRERQAS